MIGAAIGAATGLAGSIFGGIKARKAAKRARKALDKADRENQEWYNRRYNEDYTQSAEAQAALTKARDYAMEQYRNARGAAAVGGATDESVAQQKATAMSLYNKNYAKPCFNIIERVYHEADDLRRLGSAAIEMVYLAAGRVELYFEIRLFPWDIAAAIPIINEAGGKVELMFEETIPLDRPVGVIAANSETNFVKLKKIVYEELPSLPY